MIRRVQQGQRAEGEPAWAQGKTAPEIAEANFPDIKPGQPSRLVTPGTRLVYRTARARAETIALATAKRRGVARTWEGFRASTHMGVGLTGKGAAFARKMAAAARRGAVPLFVTPYITVAADPGTYQSQKQDWDEEQGHVPRTVEVEPVTYALLIPEDAVIHESSRTGQTGGILHSLTFSDAEYVIDARQVLRVWRVPPRVWYPISLLVGRWAQRLIVRGGYKGAWRDKDPDLAKRILALVLDLRPPPVRFQRPFLDVPVKTKWGPMQRDGRILLRDGTVTKIKAVREQGTARRGQNVRWSKPLWLETANFESEVSPPVWGFRASNLDAWWVERALEPGERISRTERQAVLEKNRRAITRRLG